MVAWFAGFHHAANEFDEHVSWGIVNSEDTLVTMREMDYIQRVITFFLANVLVRQSCFIFIIEP